VKKLKSYTFAISVSLAALQAASFQTHGAQHALEVSTIEVKGNQRIEEATIKSLMDLDLGYSYTSRDLNESLKNLFASGYFADANIRRQNNKVIVNVVENPIVNQVALEGNNELKDEILKSDLQLQPRQVYTLTKLKNDTQRLKTLYRLKGHFGATITPKIIKRDQNRIDVVFEIEEGEPTIVRKIFFVGNEHFSEGKLEETIQTKETRWYRFLSNDDSYDPDKLTYDRELLRQFYLERGFVDFHVKSAVAELTPDQKEFFITFTLEERERYRVSAVNINSKIPKIDPTELNLALDLHENDWFNNKKVESTIERLTDQLGKYGYAFVQVNPIIKTDVKNKTLDITFELQEGPKVYIERIKIVGNTRTDDEVIRRELRFYEGDPFNSHKLKISEKRLKNLGFFKEVRIKRHPSSFPDKLDITVEIEEDRTGELSFSGGFSTTDGPLADIKFSEHNFRGKGQDVSIGVTAAKKRQEFDFSFTQPYFLDREIVAGIDAFALNKKEYLNAPYDQQIIGGGFRIGYELSDYLTQRWGYHLRNDKITNAKSGVSNFILRHRGDSTISSVTHDILYDRRDSRINSTQGYAIGMSNEVAGLGGNVRYIKTGFNGAYYYPIAEQVVLEISGGVNFMKGLGQTTRTVDRYVLGGDTMRGFEQSGLTPRDRRTGDPLGGLISASGSSEVIFPVGLPNELGVKGAVFCDVGTVFRAEEPKNLIYDTAKPRVSVGAGLRWRSPLGPLKIDFGYPLVKASFDRTQIFLFGFSTRF